MINVTRWSALSLEPSRDVVQLSLKPCPTECKVKQACICSTFCVDRHDQEMGFLPKVKERASFCRKLQKEQPTSRAHNLLIYNSFHCEINLYCIDVKGFPLDKLSTITHRQGCHQGRIRHQGVVYRKAAGRHG